MRVKATHNNTTVYGTLERTFICDLSGDHIAVVLCSDGVERAFKMDGIHEITKADEILNELTENGSVTLSDEHNVIYIYYRSFYDTSKNYLFVLNAKPVKSCIRKKTALKYINEYIEKGYELESEY